MNDIVPEAAQGALEPIGIHGTERRRGEAAHRLSAMLVERKPPVEIGEQNSDGELNRTHQLVADLIGVVDDDLVRHELLAVSDDQLVGTQAHGDRRANMQVERGTRAVEEFVAEEVCERRAGTRITCVRCAGPHNLATDVQSQVDPSTT